MSLVSIELVTSGGPGSSLFAAWSVLVWVRRLGVELFTAGPLTAAGGLEGFGAEALFVSLESLDPERRTSTITTPITAKTATPPTIEPISSAGLGPWPDL